MPAPGPQQAIALAAPPPNKVLWYPSRHPLCRVGNVLGGPEFDPRLTSAVKSAYRLRVQRLLRAIRVLNQPGVTFGDCVGQVFVDGRPIPGLAELLNDAAGRRLHRHESSAPGFRQLLRGVVIPPKLLSDPYQQILHGADYGGDSPLNWNAYPLPGMPPGTPIRPRTHDTTEAARATYKGVGVSPKGQSAWLVAISIS